MKININNYESFLIDLLEGNLSQETEKEVRAFLLAHPEVQEELDLLADGEMDLPNITFDQKNKLKKIPFQQTSSDSGFFQEACVAKIEGTLTPQEEALFNEAVAEDKLKAKELHLFEKTILPKGNEVFDEKLFMKKGMAIHQVNHDNFDSYCVAKTEGWLDQFGCIVLNKFIKQHPEKKAEMNLYEQIVLTPDNSIQYPDKRKLKKHNLFTEKRKKQWSYAAAAAAILIFGLTFYNTEQPINKSSLSSSVSSIKSNAEQPKTQQPKQSDQFLKYVEPKPIAKSEKINTSPDLAISENRQPKPLNRGAALSLTSMTPIILSEIDCEPCKVLQSPPRELSQIKKVQLSEPKAAIAKEAKPTQQKNKADKNDELLWKLAKAGVSGINKISNSNIQLKKEKENGDTRIAFNTKYFGFSGNVNKKSND